MPGNMSTSIDELPGPLPDMQNYYEEEEEDQEQYNQQQYSQQQQQYNQHGIEINQRGIENYEEPNIKVDIKKKTKQTKMSFFQIINKELNEENLLILAILFIACLPQVTEYTVHFIMMTPLKDFLKSNISVSLFKCVLLLVLFLIIKNNFLN